MLHDAPAREAAEKAKAILAKDSSIVEAFVVLAHGSSSLEEALIWFEKGWNEIDLLSMVDQKTCAEVMRKKSWWNGLSLRSYQRLAQGLL